LKGLNDIFYKVGIFSSYRASLRQKLSRLSKLAAFLIISSLLITTVFAYSGYDTRINSNNQSWYIERKTGTLKFSLEENVRGSVTPINVTPSGRSIKNVASKYSSMFMNNVGGKETISAREGRIILQDRTLFASSDLQYIEGTDSNHLARTTLSGDGLRHESYELWPVIFKSASLVRYKGLGINSLSYEENTYDKLGVNSLYNKNFERSLYLNASLFRFNTTVDASDSTGVRALLLPTKSMDYRLITDTSGITDLYSRILNPNYDPVHRVYPDSVRSMERYVGDYKINRSIQFGSLHERYGQFDPWYEGDSWLPCCQPDEILELPQFDENLSYDLFKVQNE
jgi:hypothetical protein